MLYPHTYLRSTTLRLLLLLILNQLHIILGHLLILIHQKLQNILTQIALHCDLLATARYLRHAGPSREFLAKVLGHLLDVEPERLEPLHSGDVFALVALDTLDQDL